MSRAPHHKRDPHGPGHLAGGGPLPEPRPEQRLRAAAHAHRTIANRKVVVQKLDNPWDARKARVA